MIDVSDLEARHLSVTGAVGVAVVAIALAYALIVLVAHAPFIPWSPDWEPIIFLGFIAGLFGLLVYEGAKPEIDSWCAYCGEPVVANSRTDSHDTHFTVKVAKPPRRLTIAGQSLVLSERTASLTYCSLDCADSHDGLERMTDADVETWLDEERTPDTVGVTD